MKQVIGTLLVIAAAFCSCAKFSGDPAINPIATTRHVTKTDDPENSHHTPDPIPSSDPLYNVNGSLNLQLAKDTINTDEIQLNFDPNSQTAYKPGVDVPASQNSGLAWVSANNIPLSTYTLPLTPAGVKIGLRVNSQSDGIYSLNLKSIQAVPLAYDLWLMDKFQKDSLELLYNHTYSFNIIKADTASFSANRFKLVIRMR